MQVLNGNLLVQLVPNATATPPANVYTVNYQSDGYEQFTRKRGPCQVGTQPAPPHRERSCEPSYQTSSGGRRRTGRESRRQSRNRVSWDCRRISPSGRLRGSDTPPTPSPLPMQNKRQSDHPAVGNSVPVRYSWMEQPDRAAARRSRMPKRPGGTINGINTAFTLANTPLGSSMLLFLNGLYMTPAFDYTLSASTILRSQHRCLNRGDTLTATAPELTPRARVTSADSQAGGVPILTNTITAQVICSAAVAPARGVTAWTTLGSLRYTGAGGLNAGDRIRSSIHLRAFGNDKGV